MKKKSARWWYVYALIDPRTGQIRYVGCSYNLIRRLSGHLSDARRMRARLPRLVWLRSLLRLNLRPELKILSRHRVKKVALANERALIRKLDEQLTNHNCAPSKSNQMVYFGLRVPISMRKRLVARAKRERIALGTLTRQILLEAA